MSKRSRDEASISSIQAILGNEVPVETIELLLHRSNNNVETAINLYFTEPLPKPSTPQKTEQKENKGASFFVGELVITGWSLLKGSSPVNQGDPITIVRDKVGKATNKIVRFAAANGREVGRLPRDVAQYMASLLDQGLCTFTGSLVWCEPQLKIGDDMILSIQCYLSPAAMHTNSFSENQVPKAKKRNFDRSIQDPILLRKLALIQLFRNLGLQPVRSSIKGMNLGGENTWDKIIQSVTSAKEEETEQEVQDEDDEQKKQVTDDQLDTIYEKAQVFDAQIQPMDQPDTMTLELKEYQKRALAWMVAKEAFEFDDGDIDMRSMHPLWEEYVFPSTENEHKFFYFNPYSGELSLEFPEANSQERGGILADEMGLGKTIEILSLLHTNRFKPGIDTPPLSLTLTEKEGEHVKRTIKRSPTTMIVCPMSLLAQWRDEIIRGSSPDTITVQVFYGDERTKNATGEHLASWKGFAPDVLITTYGVLMTEWNKSQTSSTYESLLFTTEFYRVVLDEAHQIKNRTSKTSLACRDIQSKRRWAVTGTPIQNKLEDLYSLVRFLRHEPWANHTFWRTFITVPFEKQDPSALSAVQSVLEPIVLRRTKAMRDRKGQPMVPLPLKTVNLEYLSFTPQEQDIYDAIYNDSQIKFSYYCQAGKVGNNYASIFQLLTRLRQICCHPYLALQNKDKKDNETETGNNKVLRLEDLIVKLNNKEGNVEESKSTYSLNVLQNMLALQQGTDTQPDSPMSTTVEECPICFESPDSMLALPCMHIACRPCVMDYFQKKEEEGVPGECPVCRHGPILQSELLEIGIQTTDQDTQLTEDSSTTKRNVRFDIRKAVGGFKPSSKINALIKHLRQDKQDGCKTVVFSQFTSFLDLIGEALDYESIVYERLDGTLCQSQREKVLSTFAKADEKGATVLLISLRAGGVGLNLTCANRIILMDPWWNFSIEAQAIDRVHRLGQTKEVTVTRFVMRDSVEERILEIQNRKHALVNELYQSKDQARDKKFDDLQLLFGKKM